MEIKDKLKEITIEPIEVVKAKRKANGFIWGFLIGMGLQWILIGVVVVPKFSYITWAVTHKQEMTWVIRKYDAIQEAGKLLFMHD